MADEFDCPPLSDADWPDKISDMLGGFAGRLNIYRTMAHNPALLRAWADLRDHIVNRSALSPQQSEVVILRCGVRLGADYEWLQHIVRARAKGVDDVRIQALRGPVEGMAKDDTMLAQAVDELFETARLSKQTVNMLTKILGKAGVLDLMATVGFYSTLGYILNTAKTPLDDDIQAELQVHPFQAK